MLRFITPATVKVLAVLGLSLMLDFIRPLDFALRAELLFLGIIFVSLHFTLTYSLVFCALFGIFKDSFSSSFSLFHTSCFIMVTVLVNYVRTQFHARFFLKVSVVAFAIFAYALLNGLATQSFDFFTIYSFCVQSFLLFYAIDNLLLSWVHGSFREQ